MEAPNKGLLFAFMADKKKLKALPAPKQSRYLDDMDDDDIPPKKKQKYEDEPKKKKKNEVFDATPVKKKKRVDDDDVGTALALLDDDVGPRRSKTKTKLLLKTQFGQGSEKILRLLEQDDTDPAIALLYKRMLSAVVDVLPMAEMGIRKTKGVRGIHGFTMLMSQLRELMVDIQQAQDRGMMGTQLFESILKPSMSDMAQDMVLEFSNIAADAKALMSPEDYAKFIAQLRETRGNLADKMTKRFNEMKEGTLGFLQR